MTTSGCADRQAQTHRHTVICSGDGRRGAFDRGSTVKQIAHSLTSAPSLRNSVVKAASRSVSSRAYWQRCESASAIGKRHGSVCATRGLVQVDVDAMKGAFPRRNGYRVRAPFGVAPHLLR